MSSLSRAPAPSKTLLRFLRSQTDIAGATFSSYPARRCPSAIEHSQQRHISTSCQRHAGVPRSYVDDLFARNREKCKALPPPRNYPSVTLSNRHVSSESTPKRRKESAWQRWWHRKRGIRDEADGKPLPDLSFSNNGSYEETSAQLFNLSRALSRNPSGSEQKLRCTEFDENGSVTLVSGEFKKSELIAKYGLQPRDLRKIDSSILPHVLVRPSAILINLLHLRVLIQADRVLVFDAYGSTDSYTQSLFMYDLEGKLRQKTSAKDQANQLPYEFRALEAVLISVTSGLEAEFALIREPVTQILRALEEDIDREKLRYLLIHSKKLGTFEQKARLVRDALYELLEADDDLATMYLTERRKTGRARDETDHQEVEMLLESYHKICDEIVEISGNLISNIRNTEEVIKAILDANRNQLMLFEIKVSVATLGLAGGTLIAGLYGMNLENFIEESNYAFAGITGLCFVLSGWICAHGLKRLRKVQKVRMWSEGIDLTEFGHRQNRAVRGRGNWRAEALESQFMHERERNSMFQRWRSPSGATQSSTSGGGANSGPVLWPGMDGLAMHKLNTNTSEITGASTSASAAAAATPSSSSPANEYSEPTNSDADDTSRIGTQASAGFRVKDNIAEQIERERNRELRRVVASRTASSSAAQSAQDSKRSSRK